MPPAKSFARKQRTRRAVTACGADGPPSEDPRAQPGLSLELQADALERRILSLAAGLDL